MIDSSLLTIPDWNAPTNITAFTTQVSGGFSQGVYQSLNVGLHVGDKSQDVESNRCELPHFDKIHWLDQTHSNIAIQLPNKNITGDAAYTSRHSSACAVMTADCLPIIVTDTQSRVVCAIHAGWKGLRNNIIPNTIRQAFGQIPAEEIIAWIGPHIRQCHFEVDLALAMQFDQYNNAYFSTENSGKAMLDLESIAYQQLCHLGIKQITSNAECSYCEAGKYFSFRRSSHQGFENCGRMVTVIMKRK